MIKNFFNRDGDVKNLLALTAIQAGNGIFPLILFPYVLSIIGAEKFAPIVTVEAVAFFILTFTLYSFDISGLGMTIEAAKKSSAEEAKIVNSILLARITIFLTLAIVALIVSSLLFYKYALIVLVWLMFPLGVGLQSTYYYQAKNDNLILAIFVVIPRVIACLLVYVLVAEDSSEVFVCFLIAASYLISGILSLIYISTKLDYLSPLRHIANSLRLISNGRSIFLGNLSVLMYRSSNILILSLMSAGPETISLYAVAEKYVRMLQAATFSLSQLFAVRAIREITSDQESSSKVLLWKNTKFQFFVSIILIIIAAVVGQLLQIKGDLDFPIEIKIVLLIMVWAVPCGIVNYMFGAIGLCLLSHERSYAINVFFAGLAAVIISISLIPVLSLYGAACAYLAAEIILFLLIFRSLKFV